MRVIFGVTALIAAFLIGFCTVMFGWIGAMKLFAINDDTAIMTMFFGAIVAPLGGVLVAILTAKGLKIRRHTR